MELALKPDLKPDLKLDLDLEPPLLHRPKHQPVLTPSTALYPQPSVHLQPDQRCSVVPEVYRREQLLEQQKRQQQSVTERVEAPQAGRAPRSRPETKKRSAAILVPAERKGIQVV